MKNPNDYREIYCRLCKHKTFVTIDEIKSKYSVLKERVPIDDRFTLQYIVKCPKCQSAINTVNLTESNLAYFKNKFQEEYNNKLKNEFEKRLKDGEFLPEPLEKSE